MLPAVLSNRMMKLPPSESINTKLFIYNGITCKEEHMRFFD